MHKELYCPNCSELTPRSEAAPTLGPEIFSDFSLQGIDALERSRRQRPRLPSWSAWARKNAITDSSLVWALNRNGFDGEIVRHYRTHWQVPSLRNGSS